MPLSGMVYHANHGIALAIVNLPTKFASLMSTHYEDMKGNTKCRNWVAWGLDLDLDK